MFEIREIHDPRLWLDFIRKETWTLFIQSPDYGTFYEEMGEQAWIYGIYQKEILVGGSLVVSTHAKRGNFLYLPYGPILPEEQRGEALACLTAHLKDIGKRGKYHFLRVSPYLDNTPETQKLFHRLRYRVSPIHILAETTWILDIQKEESVLLQNMKKHHRNFIRRCEREGVTIEMTADPSKLALFQTMHDATAKRHEFHRFSAFYVEQEFAAFAKNRQAALFLARLPDGRLDSAAIIFFFDSMASYRHGASYGLDPHLPTSYMVQWHAIQEAKKRGCQWYNFWGIAPENAGKRHPFAGITHFKKGFGGFGKELIECQDLPLSPQYLFTWIVETARRLKRGFWFY